ncbi:putative surface layer protein [unidentified eubacterium SCB49]|nr:putative surface layer protein [unidentified eubacterium SCB49]
MKNYYKKSIAIITGLLCSFSAFSQDYTEGVFVLNEGLFGTPSAAVSHFDENGILENNIYSTQNGGAELGNTGQGMGIQEDYTYIVLNGSNAVQVVNRSNFEAVTTITDQMENPRNIAFFDGKGYVTNWGDGGVTDDDYVAVIDLETNTVLETIPVAEGPEEIVEKEGKLFIAHQGGYGFGNTISVIDAATNAVESITVGDVPSTLRIDDDFLYVLCSGKPSYADVETTGALVKIDLSSYDTIETFTFPEITHPQFLGLDETDVFYMIGSTVYKMALTATTLPTSSFIDTTSEGIAIPYGFNKIDDQLYIGDANDYVNEGSVFIYAEDGTFVSENVVGPLPNGFYKYEEEELGVNDVASSIIKVFPNPATGSFYLNTTETVAVTLYTITGQKVLETTSSNQAISLEGVKAGIYVVQLENNGSTSTQKLIVE